jgi:hypothetical protein
MVPVLKNFFHLYKKPTPMDVAMSDLEDARLNLLAALTTQAYATAQVSFNKSQVERLTAYVEA